MEVFFVFPTNVKEELLNDMQTSFENIRGTMETHTVYV